MAEGRRQLPPQIKRVELARRSGGRPVVRYQLTVDVGVIDGKRKQVRKRYTTEREARDALDAIRGEVAKGTYVHPAKRTLAEAIEDYLAGKRAAERKRSTIHGYEEKLGAASAVLGDIEVQKLTKRHVDDLVAALRAGGLPSPTGKTRKPWSPRSINYLLGRLTAVLDSEVKQGNVVRNVAALVDPIAAKPTIVAESLTEEEIARVEAHIGGDRHAAAWMLALSGLRRGEVAGLRWADVDLDEGTLTISMTRLRFGTHLVEDTPKSRAGGRTLPLPDHLTAVLKAAHRSQLVDRMALGEAYQASGFVVVNEAGEALSPHALTSRWARMLKAAGVRHVRLQDARHTCGTMMHLKNVPTALISAWLGHTSKAFTLQTYVHPHPEALTMAADSFGRTLGQLPG